jgi:hypothetical protein
MNVVTLLGNSGQLERFLLFAVLSPWIHSFTLQAEKRGGTDLEKLQFVEDEAIELVTIMRQRNMAPEEMSDEKIRRAAREVAAITYASFRGNETLPKEKESKEPAWKEPPVKKEK